jgi:hypothetical protein
MPNQADSKVDAMNRALAENPHLLANPSIASGLLSSQDPVHDAPYLMHAAQMSSLQSAFKQNASSTTLMRDNWWDTIKRTGGTSLDALGKPLQEVQKDYKYIHSLYTRHGVIWGTLGAAAVALGGSIGALAGPEGSILGADLTASALRHLGGHMSTFKDSYADSENPDYKVSYGRDMANLAGKAIGDNSSTDVGWKKNLSGIEDMGFDFTFDPIVGIGTAVKVLKQGKYISEVANKVPFFLRSDAAQETLRSMGLNFSTPEALDQLFAGIKDSTILQKVVGSSRQYNRGLQAIADTKTPAEIIAKFPKLAPLMNEFAAAKDIEQVHNVLMRTLKEPQLMEMFSNGGLDIVPNRTLIRSATSKIADKLRQPTWGNVDDAMFNKNNAANFIVPRVKADTAAFKEFVDVHAEGIMSDAKAAGQDITEEEARIQASALASQQNFKQFVRPLILDWSSKTASMAVSKKIQTFSQYMPISIDRNLRKITNSEFDPTDVASFKGILDTASFSLGPNLAKKMLTNYINSGTLQLGKFIPGPETKNIWLGIQSEVLNGLGHANDPALVSQTLTKLAEKTSATIGGQIFGWGKTSGSAVNEVKTATGSAAMALRGDQLAKWAYPDFHTFVRAGRDLNTWGRLYGTAESFFADHYIGKFFTKAATLSAGFAQRVAANEILPQIFKDGGLPYAKSLATNAIIRLGYHRSSEDLAELQTQINDILSHGLVANSAKHIDMTDPKALADWVNSEKTSIISGNIPKVVKPFADRMIGKKDIERAAQLAFLTDGHLATGITRAGHGALTEVDARAAQLMDATDQFIAKDFMKTPDGKNAIFDPNSNWTSYTPGVHPSFDFHWLTELHKSAQDIHFSSIAKDVSEYLKNNGYSSLQNAEAKTKMEIDAFKNAILPERARQLGLKFDPSNPDSLTEKLHPSKDTYLPMRGMFERHGKQDALEFANSRADALHNLVSGKDGSFHLDILNNIANGIKTDFKRIHDLPNISKPDIVPGPELKAYTGHWWSRLVDQGHKKLMDPIINTISREPLFNQHFNKAMDFYQDKVDAGIISEAQAASFSLARASHTMTPMIHNLALRSQFAQLNRVVMPFYFAQEQALKRLAYSVEINPATIRRFQMLANAIHLPAVSTQDQNGNHYVSLPGVGEAGRLINIVANKFGVPVHDFPINAQGNLISLGSVLPEFSLRFSPIVSIPANFVASIFPVADGAVKRLVGTQSFHQGLFNSLVPSGWMRTLSQIPGEMLSHAMSNSMLSAIQASAINFDAKGKPLMPEDGASNSKMENYFQMIKNDSISILLYKALTGFISPLAPKISFSDAKFSQDYQNEIKNAPDHLTALDNFLKKNGINATAYTISANSATQKGLTIPYTKDAFNWVLNNTDLITSDNYNAAAPYLIPQAKGASADSIMMTNELMKAGLRERKNPQQFVDAVHIAAGGYEFFAAEKAHTNELHQIALGTAEGKQYEAQWKSYIADPKNVSSPQYPIILGQYYSALENIAAKTKLGAEQNAHWNDWSNSFKATHPTWAVAYSSENTDKIAHAPSVMKQMESMGGFSGTATKWQWSFNPQIVKPTEQSKKIELLMNAYYKHVISLNQASKFNSTTMTSELNQQWDYKMQLAANADPTVASFINNILRKVK